MQLRVSDVDLYYEKTGSGAPLILLHGNGEDHTIFNALVAELKDQYTVYSIDSRGHGQSTPQTEFHYEVMADDVAEFIKKLELDHPILYGFSDGGIIGLIVAYKHPTLLSALVVSGANIQPHGLKWRNYHTVKKAHKKEPNPYAALMLYEPHITKADLSKIAIPTLVLAGEHDIIRKSHTRKIAKYIHSSTLKIISGENHSSYVIDSVKLLPYLSGLDTKTF